MTVTNTRLTTAVEAYFRRPRTRARIRRRATGERSSYGPLANLLNAVGATLKPKVFYVGELIHIMTSNLPTATHYIPKFLLRNFVDHSGFLCILDKKTGKLYKNTPENAFFENHLTRMYDFESGEYSYEAEKMLSDIESQAAPVVCKIINCARERQNPSLSSIERRYWSLFYQSMCRRNPEFAEEMLRHDERFDDVFYMACERLLRQHGMKVPNREHLDLNPMLSEAKNHMKKNNKSRFASGDHELLQADAERFARETGLLIAVIQQPRRSFVIGSHSVANVSRVHNGDRTYGSWLPIAYDVIVTSTSSPETERMLLIDSNQDYFITKINTASFRQSRFVAGRSESLIHSLRRR